MSMQRTRLIPNASGSCCSRSSLHAAFAQNAAPPPPAQVKGPSETMVVLGSATPVPLAESQRSVEVLPVKGESLAAESPQDFLRKDSSVFLEERGAGGGQADLVLRGGSFEQTLVLLNGFRINDAQTSHHNLDLPVPLEAMDSIQVLEGSGSTLHGVDALSGVVDFLTAAPDRDSVFLRAGEGSFESNEETLLAGATRGRWSGRVTAERNFSTGFMTDRDYRNEDASAESWMGFAARRHRSACLPEATALLAPTSFTATIPRGSGPRDGLARCGRSWAARPWQPSATGATPMSSCFSATTRRFTKTTISTARGRRRCGAQRTFRQTARRPLLLVGLEADGDSIHSFNFPADPRALGIHARNCGAGYVDFDLHPAKQRWSLSAGAREEIFSGGGQAVFSPELAGTLRVAKNLKLRASGGYGFRIPTYTDLYYSDPSTLGNPNLKPESAWSGDAGADWAPSTKLMLSATGFFSQQHDTIDYVKSATLPNSYLPANCPANIWCADNLNGLRFAGVESKLTWIATKRQTVRIEWTGLHGAQSALHGLQSEYIFNYPAQNIHGTWNWTLSHNIVVTNAVQIAERYQQTVYPVWNVAIAHDAGRIRPYLRATNLSNTGYQEIAGVNMPPRIIMGGVAIELGR